MSMKGAILAVTACLLLPVAGVLLLASTRRTLYPKPEAIRLDPTHSGTVSLLFTCPFDGLEAVETRIPPALRKHGLTVRLLSHSMKKGTPLEPDAAHSHALRRRFLIRPPLRASRGASIELRLRFDGSFPPEESSRRALFRNLSVTLFFPLHLREAIENYRRFKPVPAPVLASALLLLLYAALAGAIMRRVTERSRP